MTEIVFDDASHTYRVDGAIWPGVTQVLDPINELDGIPRAALAAAAEFGRHVHMACDLFNRRMLDDASLDPALRPYLDGWLAFLRDTQAEVLESEMVVHHPGLRYCGTVDAIVKWRGRHHVVDIKTSAAVPRTVGPQTAAYREAYLQSHLACSNTRYCVHLTGDGKYRLVKLTDPADMSIFVSCLNIHRWRNRNG